MVVTRGYYIDLVELRGNTPAIFGQKGKVVKPFLCGGAVSPYNVPEKKKKKAGALGRGCGHLASA